MGISSNFAEILPLAPLIASNKTLEVIFPSEANFLISARDLPIYSATTSKILGAFSAMERNSSPWSTPDPNACESCNNADF